MQYVPERYLDDRTDLKGTRLKLLCRLGCLPLMNRVGREQEPPWPKESRVCLMCSLGEVEDVDHFIMRCPAYDRHRQRLLLTVDTAISKTAAPIPQILGANNRLAIVLGKRIGAIRWEDKIDMATKCYLRKAWNGRGRLTRAVNTALCTNYDVVKAVDR